MKKIFGWIKEIVSLGRRSEKKLAFTFLFRRFQKILGVNNQILDLMAEMGGKLGGSYVFDRHYIESSCQRAVHLAHNLIYNLDIIAPKKYSVLSDVFNRISSEIEEELAGKLVIPQTDYVMPYHLITRDFADVVGAKNANVAELKNLLHLTAPEGFAITTRAFQCFMDHNGLRDRVKTIIADWETGNLSGEQASAEIQALIMAGTTPPQVNQAVHSALKRLRKTAGGEDFFLAVRSSAWGEDSELSFAGQYKSLLNQPAKDLLECYKTVLASTYSASAMEYRQQTRFAEHEVAMAVGCQLMIDAKMSGVMYTLDPRFPERDLALITATWGLGAPLVAGQATADEYTVSRKPAHPVTGFEIVRKAEQLVAKEGGGCEFRPVRQDRQAKPCLGDQETRRIAETGLMIERYFRKPQDIEWAVDQDDNLFILQARPLNVKGHMAKLVCDIASILKTYPVVFTNKGVVAQNGIATGNVFVVNSDEDLDRFPQGAILVAKYTSPRFAKVARKANGILTDVGSVTGHMATIAREFRIPTIVDTGIATQLLHQGQEVTVDAEDNVVYEGTIKELCYYEFTEEAFEESYEYRLLRRILKRITPLNLLDPHDKNFVPSACQTLHDITRFVHEKAVETLIDLNYYHHHDPDVVARKMKWHIPLDLVLIDIGGGINERSDASTVGLDEIVSVPMQAFLEGLAVPGAWSSDPASVDFGSFMSSLTRTFSSHLATPKYVGQNLAVISKEYANISLRLGYHFNMIDMYVGDNANDNYAYFRFLGGVTDPARRSRRARFIRDILARNDFRVDIRQDLVVGRIKKLSAKRMVEKILLLGQLVAFTRQLDVQMGSDERIVTFVEGFEQLTRLPAADDATGGRPHE
jgi:pyruvate,water dikinase